MLSFSDFHEFSLQKRDCPEKDTDKILLFPRVESCGLSALAKIVMVSPYPSDISLKL